MGEIVEALGKVEGADRYEVAELRAAIKAAAHREAINEAMPEDGRLVLDRGDGRVITLTSVKRGWTYIQVVVEWTLDGKPQPFENPLIIDNPPVLVVDDNGDIERVRRDRDTGEVISVRRFREDPLAALIEIVDGWCRRPALDATVKAR